MVVAFVIDKTRLVVVFYNFCIRCIDNMRSVKSQNAVILEFVSSCGKGSGEFREKILKSRKRDLRSAPVKKL